ncbi:hypothetical protein J9253_06085 [Thiothrix litoralis]|uniref:Uncharacterized protein n=1 Tax=Thiothrix litoralis TaxID=2891210 RepID=A0ABX7WWG0_9GAMM|nr:hypothetical protein [Thiothrix litoralis]QTR47502.1 hypothetical protein J9253_06085 [Thiothrix litoralis]
MTTLITYAELKRTVGGNTPESVVANLEVLRIRYILPPSGKPFTILSAIESAMGLRRRQDHDTNLKPQQTIEL